MIAVYINREFIILNYRFKVFFIMHDQCYFILFQACILHYKNM